MSKYDVTFTETLVYTIRVDANDEYGASESANKIVAHVFSKFSNEWVEWHAYPSDERIEKVVRMSKYDVTFTETLVYTIRVDANDEDGVSESANKIATHVFSKFSNEWVEWYRYPSDEQIEKVVDND